MLFALKIMSGICEYVNPVHMCLEYLEKPNDHIP